MNSRLVLYHARLAIPNDAAMLWILISSIFWWMILREVWIHRVGRPGYDGPDPAPISKTYVLVLLALALLFA